MAESLKPLRAVVFGGTGAVGKDIVAQLAASPRWASVTTIGRRPLDPPPNESSPGKLKQIAIDMDTLESNEQVSAVLSEGGGVDSVFCALGTTRAVAGSAEAFKKVDLDYVVAAAKVAKKAGAHYFGLVSAVGANPNLWASDLKPFHGLLYSQTKGKAEEAVKAQNFDYTTIMRPGFLERGDLARPVERIFGKFMSSVATSHVAAVMIAEAEKFADSNGSMSGVKVMEMKEIKKYDVTGGEKE